MRVSRTLLAVSAFAAGVLVALSISWLLAIGEPNSALAGGSYSVPALALAKDRVQLAEDRALGGETSQLTAQIGQAVVQPEHEVRSALTGPALAAIGEELPVALDAAIAKLYEEHPERFLELLVDQFLENGDASSALAMLKESPKADGYLYSKVGKKLQDAGNLAGAIEAHSEATRLDPMHSDSLEPLLELDPAQALLILREGLEWQPPPGNVGMRKRLAEALLAAGQTEEAVKLIDELRTAGAKGDDLTRLYARVAPEAAESELRAEIEAANGNKKISGLRGLAAMLEESGRVADTVAVLESILELSPNDARARRMIMKLDAAAAVEFLAERTTQQPENPGLWLDYGEALLAQERRVDAIAAWEHSVSLSGDQRAVRKLLEHSPATVWSHLENYTTQSGDDERWGDLGDLYWEQDRKEDAKRAWEKAWEIDPNDSEWYGKLQSIQVGRDPLQ